MFTIPKTQIYSNKNTQRQDPPSHDRCEYTNTWCGMFECINCPEITDGRSCKLYMGSPSCLENNTWCGQEHCVNYDRFIENCNAPNDFQGEATQMWQPASPSDGERIPGTIRGTHEEQQIVLQQHRQSPELNTQDITIDI